MTITGGSLLAAKQWLRERIDRGDRCPCCSQFAKVYKRRIHQTIARSLIDVYRIGGTDWVHVATAISPACEVGKARYWGLIEEEREQRSDGGRSGWWRLTELGVRFVNNQATIPMYAHIYDSRCLGLSGDLIGITEALGDRFDYRELMDR